MKAVVFHIVSLLFTIVSVFGQSSGVKDSTSLDEIVSIYAADKANPVTFLELSKAYLKLRSVGQEPTFLFSETPSITVYSDAGNTQGYSYMRLRGIDQTRINISLDGVPLNEPEDQGAYFSNYPDILNSASRVQIQRGVGTSKNGVASYGGSIQLFSPQLNDSVNRSCGIGYGSFNSLRAFVEYGSKKSKKINYYFRASEIYSNGYKYHSSNHSQSVFSFIGGRVGKHFWKINLLSGHQQNQLAWLGVSDSVIIKAPRTNANKNEQDHFLQSLISLQHTYHFTSHLFLQTTIYDTYLKGSYNYNPNDYASSNSSDTLISYAFRSNMTGLFSNIHYTFKSFQWTSGINVNNYSRSHTGSDNINGQLYENTGYKREFSFFSKLEWNPNKFNFFTDLQFRKSTFRYNGSVVLEPVRYNFFNYRFGLSWFASAKTTFYYSYGKTGREPTRNDLFGGNDNLTADSAGRAQLFIVQSENVQDHEIGFRFSSGRSQLDANFYFMDFKNEIVLDGKFGPNGIALTDKVQKSFRSGIEIHWSWIANKNLSLLHNSSFNYSRINEQKISFVPILTPAYILNQEIKYSHNKWTLSLIGRYQGRSYIDFANAATIPFYFILNSRATYQIGNLQCSLFLNNLTNTRYFNNGYVDFDNSRKYFVQAPLNWYISFIYQW